MSMLTSQLTGVMAAARTSAVIFDRTVEGRLRALDRDRIDLLHRMSTNDLTGMTAGEARRTVLTTAIGRMVDVLWVLHRGETALCLSGPGMAGAVRKWLAGHTFYNDRVKYEEASNDLTQFGVYGPRAGAVLTTVANGAAGLEANRFVERDQAIVLRGHPFGALGYTVIAPRDQAEALWGQIVAAGAVAGDEAAYQALRLARGEPQAGREITEAYIPLEANLWSVVSFSKGCYIGQEIIARMESRGKLARRLMGLRLAGPVAEGAEVCGADGAVVGVVTSAGDVPDLGPLALAYVKAGIAAAGVRVRVGGVEGEVVELPFLA